MLAPLLGVDNMVGAFGLAVVSRDRRTWITTCVSFGLFAAMAVLVGSAVGVFFAATLARDGRFLAAVIIAALGVRALWPASTAATRPHIAGVTTGAIIVLGITLSGDTLAASIALGAAHATQGALVVITACTVAMTALGLAAGANADRFPVARKRVTGLALIMAACGVAAGWI
jgi:putative Mn2+ efflux pump MntP